MTRRVTLLVATTGNRNLVTHLEDGHLNSIPDGIGKKLLPHRKSLDSHHRSASRAPSLPALVAPILVLEIPGRFHPLLDRAIVDKVTIGATREEETGIECHCTVHPSDVCIVSCTFIVMIGGGS